MIEEIRAQMPRIGGRKLYYLLKEPLLGHGIDLGRDRFYDVMAVYGLGVRRRKRRKVITTNSNHPYRKYPNLIQNLVTIQPHQLWVSDITYLALTGGNCYLSLVTDAYSRKIVGYCVYPSLEKQGPLQALRMALATLSARPKGLIHHSDRGLQYCSGEYTCLLEANTIAISMTEQGDPTQNAIAERVNGILKTELGLDRTFNSLQEAKAGVDEAIRIYNEQRPHSSLDYLTPRQAHQRSGALPKRWKPRHEATTQ